MGLWIKSANRKNRETHNQDWFDRDRPYRKKHRLLSPSEAIMLEKLRLVFPRAEYEVFANVRLADLVEIEVPRWQSKRLHLELNDIARLHVDFVVCKKTTTEILAAIELDDPSHDNLKAEFRDKRKDRALESAGVRLFRFRVENDHSYQHLRDVILGHAKAADVEDVEVVEVKKESGIKVSQGMVWGEAERVSGWRERPAASVSSLYAKPHRKWGEGMNRFQKKVAVNVVAFIVLGLFVKFVFFDGVTGIINNRVNQAQAQAAERVRAAQQARQEEANKQQAFASVRRIVSEQKQAEASNSTPPELVIKRFDEEAAWDRWYKRPGYCDAGTEQAIKACANDYIRKRREFEGLVASGKIQ